MVSWHSVFKHRLTLVYVGTNIAENQSRILSSGSSGPKPPKAGTVGLPIAPSIIEESIRVAGGPTHPIAHISHLGPIPLASLLTTSPMRSQALASGSREGSSAPSSYADQQSQESYFSDYSELPTDENVI